MGFMGTRPHHANDAARGDGGAGHVAADGDEFAAPRHGQSWGCEGRAGWDFGRNRIMAFTFTIFFVYFFESGGNVKTDGR